eukprot:2002785-Amphidinium_carterae.2
MAALSTWLRASLLIAMRARVHQRQHSACGRGARTHWGEQRLFARISSPVLALAPSDLQTKPSAR